MSYFAYGAIALAKGHDAMDLVPVARSAAARVGIHVLLGSEVQVQPVLEVLAEQKRHVASESLRFLLTASATDDTSSELIDPLEAFGTYETAEVWLQSRIAKIAAWVTALLDAGLAAEVTLILSEGYDNHFSVLQHFNASGMIDSLLLKVVVPPVPLN
jgi:hypothetical protein